MLYRVLLLLNKAYPISWWAITIIVSLGLKAEVPNLIGYTYQEASNILQEIGLLPSASGDTGGRVSGQNPEEGSFLDPEGFVELSFDN